ncbi:phenylalanine--tRNA ligase subunit alpha [Candidatus Mycoplasma haematominutum]|uniref:tRNA ligase subunit PheS family protein n=1 Tax=Candidatus Mycoplasma haematominutum TaxID=209446 RepID=UPI001FE1C0B1|nr:phenylalanine--tRNA ligase subunit alpha [Candidatus Mycoplasma haematominutum]
MLVPLRSRIFQSRMVEEKKTLGLQFQEISKFAQNLYDDRKRKLSAWAQPFYHARECAVKENRQLLHQSNNLFGELITDIFRFLQSYNFSLFEESEIVKVSSNFDSLLISPEHPARASSDSFFLDDIRPIKYGEPMMLRTHTTTSTLKLLDRNKGVSFRGASVGSVYRKEDNNSTHLSQFTQLDLVWVDQSLTLSDLRNWIETLLFELFKTEARNYRLRLSYFPFTSPSYEVDLSCTCKLEKQCSLCKGTGWIEILGCGFLRKEILEKTHPGKVSIAAGLGLERIAMVKFRLSDIRDLYKNDLDALTIHR